LTLISVTSIPEGFNPTVGYYLDLKSVTSIPEGFNPTIEGSLNLQNVTSIPEGFNPTIGGNLYLESVTSIPEGFNPTVGGSLNLQNVTSIPEGFNPTIGGSLNLKSVTSIPEGFNPTVGGFLNLRSVTSIPEGFNLTIGGSLNLKSVTSIPEGFNPTIGGNLYLQNVTSIPEGFCKSDFEYKDIPFLSWQNEKFILVDRIFTEVISKKSNVYLVKKINQDKQFYIVTDGNGKYAHGDTIQQAKEDLIYKITNKNKDNFKDLTLESVLSFEKAIEAYRVITGACSFGVKDFIQNSNIESKDYSIKQMIELTQDKYGNETFKAFFK
jgi:hypothetical protein